MTDLAKTIVSLVQAGHYVVGLHAAERLEQRGILEWQVIEAMGRALFLDDRPDGVPHPVAVFQVLLPDGAPIKAVGALMRRSQTAKLVTIFFL